MGGDDRAHAPTALDQAAVHQVLKGLARCGAGDLQSLGHRELVLQTAAGRQCAVKDERGQGLRNLCVQRRLGLAIDRDVEGPKRGVVESGS